MQLLTDEFISRYPEFPAHMNELGKFVYYRTYSRWLPDKRRRETWKETCRRAVEYNVGLAVKHLRKIGYEPDMEEMRREAEELFDSMFNLRQFLSGRTLWVGGAETGVAEKYPLANFNCSFLEIRSWEDLGDLFYLLLVGTGVGFRCSKEMVRGLAPIRTNTTLIHSEYNPLPPHQRLERTRLEIFENGYAKIFVGDSKEGWVEALRTYFALLTDAKYEHVHTIKISYNSVRPRGERLKTFGGTASGPEPLREMFDGIDRVLKNQIDPYLAPIETDEKGYGRVRPIHILDIGNLIGNNVVVGGVRRTAEIFLFDPDDYEAMFAKYGINGLWGEEGFERHREIGYLMDHLGIEKPAWWDKLAEHYYALKRDPMDFDETPVYVKHGDDETLERLKNEGYTVISDLCNPGRPYDHRRMSNNSIVFERKPSRQFLNFVFAMMRFEGEPGFVNLEEANRRRPNAKGVNPCAEILLDSYGVCNLTTVNVTQFVRDGKIDWLALLKAQRRSVRAALRMTLAELELPHWNAIQQRDRLLGCSLTGWKDAFAMRDGDEDEDDGFEEMLMEWLREAAHEEAVEYAKKLRVSPPLLVTTVKPEGTLSQVAGGVSSGLHYSHAPYYIRRIRINTDDPLTKVAKELGWKVVPDPTTKGRTSVIEFYVKSGANKTKNDVYIDEQFDTYFRFQKYYTDHNSSNTIHVRPDEWERAEEIVWNRWDEYTAVSFISYDGGTYNLAPYEEISAEQYEELSAKMKPFDPSLLAKYETGDDFDIGTDGCESGACPIR